MIICCLWSFSFAEKKYNPENFLFCFPFCQTPDLGQGLEFDFTFANNNENNENNDNENNDNENNNNPHLNFPGWDGTRGLKFGTQT